MLRRLALAAVASLFVMASDVQAQTELDFELVNKTGYGIGMVPDACVS